MNPEEEAANWRSTVDPNSGKTYWYHRKTRQSTWEKPQCLIQVEKLSLNTECESFQIPTLSQVDVRRMESSTMQLESYLDSHEKNSFVGYSDLQFLIGELTNKVHEKRNSAIILLNNLLDSLDSSKNDISQTLFQLSNLVASVVNNIVLCKSSESKLIGYKVLFKLSMTPASNKIFMSELSWASLKRSLNKDEILSGIYFIASSCFLLMSEVRDLVIDQLSYFLIEWIASLSEGEVFNTLESLLDVVIGRDNLFNVDVLCCLGEIASRGFELPGVFHGVLIKHLIRSRSINSTKVLLSGGFESLLYVLNCHTTVHSIKINCKSLLLEAMQTSSALQSYVVDKFLTYSADIDMLGHAATLQDPRVTHFDFVEMETSSLDILDDNQHTILDTDEYGKLHDLPILRDVEWRPKSGSSWRICSSLMWIRCPALRGIIDDFWDNGGGGLELNIDASWDTLNAVCQYIHKGAVSLPCGLFKKLELVKVAKELNMIGFLTAIISVLKYSLDTSNIDIVHDFCVQFDINELQEICDEFVKQKPLKLNIFDTKDMKNSNVTTNSRDNLAYEISANINAVNRVLTEENKSLELLNTADQLDHKQSKRTSGSGGIYGLLLDSMDDGHHSGRAPTITKPTPLEAIPMPIKAKKPSNEFSGLNIVEYDRNMTLEPDSRKKEDNSRTSSLAKPKGSTIISKQDKSVSLPTNKGKLTVSKQPPNLPKKTATLPNSKMTQPLKSGEAVNNSSSIGKSKETVDKMHLASNTKDKPPIIEVDLNINRRLNIGTPVNTDVRNSLQLLKSRTKRRPVSQEVVNSTPHSALDFNSTQFQTNEIDLNESTDNLVLNEEINSCPHCGRNFNVQSLEKHAKVCSKVFVQKRKVFDSKKMRIQDNPELLKLTQKKKQSIEVSETKSKWREASNYFREAMKQAKLVNQAVENGTELPAFVPSQPDPSLVPCPHCGRRFNLKAADRHIPICNQIKAKPSFLKKGSSMR